MSAAIQAVLTFLIFLPFIDRRRSIVVHSDADAGLQSSFVAGHSTAYPGTATIEADCVSFDVQMHNPPTPPLSILEKHPLPYSAPPRDECVEMEIVRAPPASTTSHESGNLTGFKIRKPSLVLKPKLHPTLYSFKSPVRPSFAHARRTTDAARTTD